MRLIFVTMQNLPLNTSIVCHDIGSANIIFSSLLHTGRSDWRPYLLGPAKRVWSQIFPNIKIFDSLEDALYNSSFLITGAGWGSNVEHVARKLAKKSSIKSVAVVDHWINYEERFIRDGEKILPNEIWVADKFAFNVAYKIFHEIPIKQISNLYLEGELKSLPSVDRIENPELVYMLEPTRACWGRTEPGEFQALDYFISHLPLLNLPTGTLIRLRPHPADEAHKYDAWIKRQFSYRIVLDSSRSVSEALVKAKWVVGCESSALIIALIAGREVYCSLPPWAPPCRLPHEGLRYIRELKGASNAIL